MSTKIDPGRHGERGQVLVIGVFVILGLIAMSALVLEGGNAFAQQRRTQNTADAVANAGAVVLAQRLGGAAKSDTDVANAVAAIADANGATGHAAYYTDLQGKRIDINGTRVSVSGGTPAQVGGGTIPPNAQGIDATASAAFGTTIGKALGFSSFTASADATAITGELVGGPFLPVIFPVSITDCNGNGTLPPFTRDQWLTSDPPTSPGGFPTNGPEYIVPLCKSFGSGGGSGSGGSFQILDLDPSMTCEEEAANPPAITWNEFPVWVDLDNGNNCAKPIADVVNSSQRLTPVLIPICDTGSGSGVGCESQSNGSKGQYHVSGVAAFYIDYMIDDAKNSECQGGTSPNSGQTLTNIIGGNGSSACVVGWFINFITTGPVGPGTIEHGDSIAVQLIR